MGQSISLPQAAEAELLIPDPNDPTQRTPSSMFPALEDYKLPETVDIVDSTKSWAEYAELCLEPNISDE
eukprot:7525812-Karenia_brevis.AAC.1